MSDEGRKKHRSEIRTREVIDSFCVEPDCEFFNQHAVQGHCHTTEPDVSQPWDKIWEKAKDLSDVLQNTRKNKYSDPEEYIPWLESMYECAMLNWAFGLDECIRLRREVALLRHKLTKLEGPDESLS